jgi:signal transduction histidine kinase
LTPATIDLSDAPDRRRWWVPVLGWSAAVLMYALMLRVQIGLPFRYGLPNAAVYVYTLALLMIPVRRWCARLHDVSRPVSTIAVAHAAMAIAVLAIWFGVQFAFHRLTIGPFFWRLVYADSWLFQIVTGALAYGAAVGVTIAAQAWARERQRDRREHELVIAARDAELSVLKAQFQPHFVLNALNSLLALVDRDPALARTMIVRLADLMKAVFERADTDQVPLERELDLVRAYLDVERIRLGSRLAVTFEIDDAARGAMVPALLLQPIVENAVKHGVAPYATARYVEVQAAIAHGRLQIVVRDAGHGASPQVPAALAFGTGRGLQITRRRLDGAYGDGYRLTFNREPSGTAVRIDLPAEGLNVA